MLHSKNSCWKQNFVLNSFYVILFLTVFSQQIFQMKRLENNFNFFDMFFCLRVEPLLKFEVSALKLGRSQNEFCWFFFNKKIFLIKTFLDKWKAVLTILPKHFRPVVRKVLDHSPESLKVYEFFHNIFFSKLFLCTRRMKITQPCRKFFVSKSERII